MLGSISNTFMLKRLVPWIFHYIHSFFFSILINRKKASQVLNSLDLLHKINTALFVIAFLVRFSFIYLVTVVFSHNLFIYVLFSDEYGSSPAYVHFHKSYLSPSNLAFLSRFFSMCMLEWIISLSSTWFLVSYGFFFFFYL